MLFSKLGFLFCFCNTLYVLIIRLKFNNLYTSLLNDKIISFLLFSVVIVYV